MSIPCAIYIYKLLRGELFQFSTRLLYFPEIIPCDKMIGYVLGMVDHNYIFIANKYYPNMIENNVINFYYYL